MRTPSSQWMLLATPLLEAQVAAMVVLEDWRMSPGSPTTKAVEAAVFGEGFWWMLVLVSLPILMLAGIGAALFCVGWRPRGVDEDERGAEGSAEWARAYPAVAAARAASVVRLPAPPALVALLTQRDSIDLELRRARPTPAAPGDDS